MLAKLVVLLGLVVGVLLALRWFTHTPPRQVTRLLRRIAMGVLVGGAVLLAATGRLDEAEQRLLQAGVVAKGDLIVLTYGDQMGLTGGTNTLTIVRVGERG